MRQGASSEELATELMGAVDRARTLGLARSIDISFEISGDSGHGYRVSRTSFARVLDNLLVNAGNAVPDRGAVAVTLDEDAAGLRLIVSDTGPGMPEEFLPRAFERFSRPDVARSGASGGSGLGLALVHAIVVDAGGTVRLHNIPQDFRVEVRLPKM
jgi:signal transduction histidine kinase